MSRVVFHDLNNRSIGELEGFCDRGWTLIGDSSTVSGAQTSMDLQVEQVSLDWLQLGRMVLIEHPKLPAWAGIVDVPWTPTLPGKLAIYNAEYLLNQRCPENAASVSGNTGQIANQMIYGINAQEETYLRLGEVEADASREEPLDQRGFWAQLSDIVQRAGMEMRLRPVKQGSQLLLYMDIKRHIGLETGFLFHDGEHANMRITQAQVTGPILNRVIGINDQPTENGRLATPPQINWDSVRKYRMRSGTFQINGIKDLTTLTAFTQMYLAQASHPQLTMNINIEDQGEAFRALEVGNSAIFHASNVHLPGGVQGFHGAMRIKALAYDESMNVAGVKVQAAL